VRHRTAEIRDPKGCTEDQVCERTWTQRAENRVSNAETGMQVVDTCVPGTNKSMGLGHYKNPEHTTRSQLLPHFYGS